MQVQKWSFEEAGERDDEGRYTYHYAGFYYLFRQDDADFKARSYLHSPTEAHFIGYRRSDSNKMLSRYWYGQIPYSDELFQQAVRYLVEHEGMTLVTFLLCNGSKPYLPVNITVCLGKQ